MPLFVNIRARQPRGGNGLIFLTLLSIFLGLGLGLGLNGSVTGRRNLTTREATLLQFPGDMYLRMLKSIVVPIIISNNISSVALLSPKGMKVIGLVVFVYVVSSGGIAVLIGGLCVSAMRPGDHKIEDLKSKKEVDEDQDTLVVVLDIIRNMVPENIVTATFSKDRITIDFDPAFDDNNTGSNDSVTSNMIEAHQTAASLNKTNLLGLILYSTAFGIACMVLRDQASAISEVFHSTRRVMNRLAGWIVIISPIGIMFNIAGPLSKTINLSKAMQELSWFIATDLTALFIHAVIVLPITLIIFARRNPIVYFLRLPYAFMTAFGTSSSTATISITQQGLINNKINPKIVQFMLPLTTTINMNGTAIHQVVAVIYLAQLFQRELTVSETVLVISLGFISSLSTPAMPSASLFTMALIMKAVNIPSTQVGVIISADWLLDRIRTMVNIWSNAVGIAICDKVYRQHVKDFKTTGSTISPTKSMPADRHRATARQENSNHSVAHKQRINASLFSLADLSNSELSPLNSVSSFEDSAEHESEPLGECGPSFDMSSESRQQALVYLTLASIVCGVALGLGLNASVTGGRTLTTREVTLLQFPGEMYLRMLKSLVVPIIISNNICSVALLNIRGFKLITLVTLGYILFSGLTAVVTAGACVSLMKPGEHTSSDRQFVETKLDKKQDTLVVVLDIVRNMIPDNIIAACFSQDQIFLDFSGGFNGSNESALALQEIIEAGREVDAIRKTNLIGLILYSTAFGLACMILGEKVESVTHVFHATNRVMAVMTSWILIVSPIGILFTVAGSIAKIVNLGSALWDLAMFIATDVTALMIHGCITLPIVYGALVRKNPVRFFFHLPQAFMTAFGTASSTATISITQRGLLENNINAKIVKFMLPVGTIVNMNGTAIHQVVAVLFLAQVFGHSLSTPDTVLVILLGFLSSLSTPALPSASLYSMAMIMRAVDIPSGEIGLIISVDWLLDRIRTGVNIWSNTIGISICDKLYSDRLIELEYEDTAIVHEQQQESDSEKVANKKELAMTDSSIFTMKDYSISEIARWSCSLNVDPKGNGARNEKPKLASAETFITSKSIIDD